MTQHFFIIGAQRSGTSSLYAMLDQHPEIAMAKPLRPEPKYFLHDKIGAEGVSGYHLRCFPEIFNPKVLGEKSTSYIESESAAKRIAQWIPEAKIVAILREPIARAISNYRFSVENGLESLDIEEAFSREEERVQSWCNGAISTSPFAYLKRGRYCEYLSVYLRYFARDRIFIALTEEILDSDDEKRRLLDFLDVSSEVGPNLGQLNQSKELYSSLPTRTRSLAKQYFEDSNRELVTRFGLNLGAWEHA